MKRQHKRGFTVMEVLITLTLLVVVLAILSGVIYQVYKFYYAGEELWIVKQEVTAVTDWMIDSVQRAAEAHILTESYTSEKAFDTSDQYIYIYQATDDGFIYYRNPGSTTATPLSHMPVNCQFKIPSNTKRAMEFTVGGELSSGQIYDVDSAVTLLNLSKITEITGNTGTAIKLGGNDLILSQMSTSVAGGMCFVATAAYGSPISPSVLLLRDFRDNILLDNKAGQAFVGWYYSVSPPLAKIIENNPFLILIARIFLIPLIIIAIIIMFPQMYIAVGLSLLLAVYYFKRSGRKYVKVKHRS